MQFPESWLREYCNPDLSSDALADALTMAGLEVEEVCTAAPDFSGVVVGRIVSIAPHPDADRLRVCQVDVGSVSDSPLEIVCGAKNAREGIRVPCATVGAALPTEDAEKPFVIRKSKLRGVASFGMLCSTDELGLPDDGVDGLLELPEDAPVGEDVRQYLKLDEKLFTIKLTPNLGHCLSIQGVAMELAAITGTEVRQSDAAPADVQQPDAVLATEIQAEDLCGRFSGRVVRGVRPQDAVTPQWMVQRLQRCGQRPVSPLVDISNYVMFEMGQPSHIFDAATVTGGLQVRWGRAGEKLKLLNGETIELDEAVGVIADDDGVKSLAGIMGGDACAVSESTTDIYIEAAHWHPDAVAGRSRRYQFATEAGHRFERGVDPQLTVRCLERITELVQSICGGQAGPVSDTVVMPLEPRTVQMRASRAARVIGIAVSAEDCAAVFRRLGFAFSADDGVFSVQVPVRRFDITLEEDLIEEVVRLYGYDRLSVHAPVAAVRPCATVTDSSSVNRFALRRRLAALGYTETISYSFVPAQWEADFAGNSDPVRLLNPIASHLDVMRSSLMGSLVQVLRHNLDRGCERACIFELARVFRRNSAVQTGLSSVAGVEQKVCVAGLLYGSAVQKQWGMPQTPADYFDIKGDVEQLMPNGAHWQFEKTAHPALHPGRSAAVLANGEQIGVVGELHPRWKQQYELPRQPVLLFELDVDAVSRAQHRQSVPVSKYQSVERDLAVVLDDAQSWAQVQHAVSAARAQYVQQVELFDVYRPRETVQGMQAHEKSLAVRLLLNNPQATLTEAEIQQDVDAVLLALQQQCGARLRG